MKISMGPDDMFGTFLTLFASFRRVILPMAQMWPPPTALNIYDAYIGLNPVASHSALTLFWFALQMALWIVSPGFLDLYDRLLPFILIGGCLLYECHAPLSSDRRTTGLPDARITVLSGLVCLWALTQMWDLYTQRMYSPWKGNPMYSEMRARLGFMPFLVISFIFTAVRTFATYFALIPLYFAWNYRRIPPGGLRARFLLPCVGCLIALCMRIAAISQRKAHTARNPEAKFTEGGIYAWVRQPIALSEHLFWWSLNLVGILLTRKYLNWSSCGPALMSFFSLFFEVTSERMMAKDRRYRKEVQTKVWRLLPLPPSFTGYSRPVATGPSVTQVSREDKKSQ